MKTQIFTRLLPFIAILIIAPAVYGQPSAAEASRLKTRDRLGNLLQRIGSEVKIDFKQSEKNQFAFLGTLTQGLKNVDRFDVVVRITTNETIFIRAFPFYKNSYISLDKAKNPAQLMKQMLQFNDTTFLSWGADDTADIFTGYTITLESGFPDEAIKVVLSSIRNSDEYIGKLRPAIDGTIGQ
jgi:hypothetical protein